jgi:hypothetical protein
MNGPIPIAFEKAEFTIPVSSIVPQRAIPTEHRRTAKYKMIADSLKSIGLIEALVVYPKGPDEYLLLDGHYRLKVLKELGVREVRCTISTDDEGYTYNKKVNAVSHVGQHFMILKALENGVPEERLSQALGVNLKNLRIRRDLLNGICPEAVQILRNKKVSIGVFAQLRKMKPLRQIEVAEQMGATNTFSVSFAKTLLALSKPDMLMTTSRKLRISAASPASQEMLGVETERLINDMKAIEQSYGKDILSLTVCAAYMKKLLANPRVEDHLSRYHAQSLTAIREAIASENIG